MYRRLSSIVILGMLLFSFQPMLQWDESNLSEGREDSFSISRSSTVSVTVEGDDYDTASGDYEDCTTSSTCNGFDYGTSFICSPGTGWFDDDSCEVVYEIELPIKENCVSTSSNALSLSVRYDTHGSNWRYDSDESAENDDAEYTFKVYDFASNQYDKHTNSMARATGGGVDYRQFSKFYTAAGYSADTLDGDSATSTLKVRFWVDEHTELEIDSLIAHAIKETNAPTNPSSPTFNNHPGPGLWTSDNSISSISFATPGTDNCDYDYTEYMISHSSSNSNPTCSSGSGTIFTSNSNNNLPAINFQDGYNRICWRGVDGYGNTATWSESNVFKIDSTPPSIPTISNTWVGSWYNSGSNHLTMQWSSSTDATSGIDEYEIRVQGLLAAVVSSSTTSYSLSRNDGLICGNNSIAIVAKDYAGNTRTYSASLQYDDCNPGTVISSWQSNQWSNLSNPLIMWQKPNDTGCGHQLSFDGRINNGTWTTNIVPNSYSSSSLSWSPFLNDGIHWIQIRTTDCALPIGNSELGQGFEIKIDTISPSIQVGSSSHGNNWSSNPTINIFANSTDYNPTISEISGSDEIWILLSRTSNIPFSDIINSSDDEMQCQVNSACRINYSENVSSGSYYIHAATIDKAGNKNWTTSIQPILVDIDTPDTPSINILSTQFNGFVNSRNVSFGLGGCGSICDTHSGISSVHWSLDNNGIVPIISGVNTTSNTSGVIELVSLNEGNHEFCIRSIDVVGNLGPVRCLNFTIDSINPNLIVDCALCGSWTNTNSITFEWNSSDSNGIYAIAHKFGSESWNYTNNSGDRTISNLSSGIYPIQFSSTDSAGLVTMVNLSIRIDRNSPIISLFQTPSSSGWIGSNVVHLEYNVSDLHSGVVEKRLRVQNSTQEWNLSSLMDSGTHSIALSNGIHQLVLEITDEVGYTSSQSIIVRVDSTQLSLTCSIEPASWTNSTPIFNHSRSTQGPSASTWWLTWAGNNLTMPGTSYLLQNLSEGRTPVVLQYQNQAGSLAICGADALVDRSSPILWTAPTPQVVNSTSYELHIAAFDFYSGISQITFEVNGQMLAPENNLIANSNHSIIRTISLLEGMNNIRITVIDQAGNSDSTNLTILSDTTSPTISTFFVEGGGEWRSTTSILLNYNVYDLIDLNPSVDLLINGAVYEYNLPSGTNLLEINLNVTNGEHQLSLRVNDAAGNYEFSESITIRIDTMLPECFSIPEIGEIWSNEHMRIFNLLIDSGPSGISTAQLNFSNGTIQRLENNFDTGESWNQTIYFSDGKTEAHLWARTVSGLDCESEINEQWIDSDEGDIEILYLNQNYDNFADGQFSVVWRYTENTEPTLSNSIVRFSLSNSLEQLLWEQTIDSFEGSLNYPLNNPLENGTYQFEIVVEDDAGNNVFRTKEFEVIRDYSPPVISCWVENHNMESPPIRTEIELMEYAENYVQSVAGFRCSIQDETMEGITFNSLIDNLETNHIQNIDNYNFLMMPDDPSRISWFDEVSLGSHNITVIGTDVFGNSKENVFNIRVYGNPQVISPFGTYDRPSVLGNFTWEPTLSRGFELSLIEIRFKDTVNGSYISPAQNLRIIEKVRVGQEVVYQVHGTMLEHDGFQIEAHLHDGFGFDHFIKIGNEQGTQRCSMISESMRYVASNFGCEHVIYSGPEPEISQEFELLGFNQTILDSNQSFSVVSIESELEKIPFERFGNQVNVNLSEGTHSILIIIEDSNGVEKQFVLRIYVNSADETNLLSQLSDGFEAYPMFKDLIVMIVLTTIILTSIILSRFAKDTDTEGKNDVSNNQKHKLEEE